MSAKETIQDRIKVGCETVYCQLLLVQGQGSQYFQVRQPSDEGPDIVPIGGDGAWAQVGKQMAKAWAKVETRAQTTIQEGERDEVNP